MASEATHGSSEPLAGPLLDEIEAVAVELAQLAGAEIAGTLGREITVEYKTAGRRGDHEPTNPVSEVDHAVEALVRERLAVRFPGHGIIGEEVELHPDPSHDFVWVIDPVDGTTNFVNGFPLFAASIGVLHRGVPIAGAIWCSTSHELRAGVYHARSGGPLRFEGREVPLGRPSVGVRRRLIAGPGGRIGRDPKWDSRVTGSAAIECAFVAAGIFSATAFWGLAIWDVAAGIVLVRAAGRDAWTRNPDGWSRLDRFVAPAKVKDERAPTLRDWRQPLLIGTEDATAPFRIGERGPRWWWRIRLATRLLTGR
ncbi:MAG: inositol monophosphatase [Dehalococcoidia bacterium]